MPKEFSRRKALKALGGTTVAVAGYTSVASAATRSVTVNSAEVLASSGDASYRLEFTSGTEIYGSLPYGDTDTWDVDRSAEIKKFRIDTDGNPVVKVTTSGNSSDTSEGRIEITGNTSKLFDPVKYEMDAVGCIQNDAQPNLELEDNVYDCEITEGEATGDEDSYTVDGQISFMEIQPNEGYFELDRLE